MKFQCVILGFRLWSRWEVQSSGSLCSK